MRLFLAITLPSRTCSELEQGIRCLRERDLQAKWCRRENLHLTLEFLGEVADPVPVREAMRRVSSAVFSLAFSDCGRFHGRGGDILWLGIAPSKPLMRLQSDLHKELSITGVSLEQRAYRPHLTLARRLRCQEEFRFPDPLPDPFLVRHFSLIRSELGEDGPRYTELERKELSGCV